MATVLEQYNDLKGRISAQIAAGQFPPEQMLQYQEMLYRIDVLENCLRNVVTTVFRFVKAHSRCFLTFSSPGSPKRRS